MNGIVLLHLKVCEEGIMNLLLLSFNDKNYMEDFFKNKVSTILGIPKCRFRLRQEVLHKLGP